MTDPIQSLRDSAAKALRAGRYHTAAIYRQMADDAERSGMPDLYRHWAREAEQYVAQFQQVAA
jgi:hypothetical protein